MDKESKSGKIILHEEEGDIELGRPVLEMDKEMISKTFEAQFPMVQDALWEALRTISKEYPKGVSVLEDPEEILEEVKKELKKNNPALALAIIEAGLYSVNRERDVLERKKEEAEDINDESLQDRIDLMQALETRYSETEDFLFTHSDFAEILPSKDHLLAWVADEKRDIEKGAKEEKNEGLKKLYDSRLKSVVPAYDRFLKEKQVVGDYNTLLSSLEERLQMIRELINDDLLEYLADKNEAGGAKIKRNSKLVYTLRSFLALMEGERNERIALKK